MQTMETPTSTTRWDITYILPSLNLRVRTWKWMVGRLSRFLLGRFVLFSGAMPVSFRRCITSFCRGALFLIFMIHCWLPVFCQGFPGSIQNSPTPFFPTRHDLEGSVVFSPPEAQAGAACPARLPWCASLSDVASGSAMAGGSLAISDVVRGVWCGHPNVRGFLDLWTIAFTNFFFN